MAINYATNSINLPFHGVWSVLDQQKGPLTCTTISPSGIWVVSGSQDGTILFVDHKLGVVAGRLHLGTKFYATATTWLSDTILVFGCSNGVVYHLDFEHKNRRPVSVHALVKPLKSPVRSVAFDTFRDMLAVACGGEVWIYVRSVQTGTESWDCVDHILAPCGGRSGLVTALCFFGTTLGYRYLFIGHAKAGWAVWLAPRSYHRTPFTESGNVCSIGSAAIPPSEQFIAIATLDNSIVTYSLRDGSPAIETRFETKYQEATKYRPVLPIVSTSNGLVMKGTPVGDIDVLDPKTHSVASLHHAPKCIIRTLNGRAHEQAYGDKLVVGSSNLAEDSSCLCCYAFSSAPEPQGWRGTNGPQGPSFEMTLNSDLSLTEQVTFRNFFKMLSMGQITWLKLRWKRGRVFLLFGLFFLLVALVSSPPSRSSSVSTRDVRVLHSPYSQSKPPRNPTLSTLVMWCTAYLSNQFSEWVIWSTQTTIWMVKFASYGGLMAIKNLFFALNWFTRWIFLVPRLLKEVFVEVPDILANFICDILRVHGLDDVCPE